jgi:hypothetical protein
MLTTASSHGGALRGSQIAYNVVDLEAMPADADALQEALFQVEGVISSRILSGLPRTHFRSKY